jgi:hypothetical protein
MCLISYLWNMFAEKGERKDTHSTYTAPVLESTTCDSLACAVRRPISSTHEQQYRKQIRR